MDVCSVAASSCSPAFKNCSLQSFAASSSISSTPFATMEPSSVGLQHRTSPLGLLVSVAVLGTIAIARAWTSGGRRFLCEILPSKIVASIFRSLHPSILHHNCHRVAVVVCCGVLLPLCRCRSLFVVCWLLPFVVFAPSGSARLGPGTRCGCSFTLADVARSVAVCPGLAGASRI